MNDATCADCDAIHPAEEMFAISPPKDRTEGGGKLFWLCVPCWDGIVADALLTRVRMGGGR